MDPTAIKIEIRDHLGIITLNRPEFLNTFNTVMAAELRDWLRLLDEDTRVRVMVVKGAGKAFCAGIDVKELFGKSPLEYKNWIELMESPLAAIAKMKKPVIAQVHGVAAANGAGLVAACDLAVAAASARLGFTAINVGLNCIGPVVPAVRSIGRKRALELLFGGELIPAVKALEMGFINRVVPDESLEEETLKWALDLARKSPLALQIAKQAYYNAEDMGYAQAFEYMNEAFAKLCTTEDASEGVKAFLEKRDPLWKGR